MALLTWTQSYFKTHGVESPRLDAEILLAHILECRRIDLYLRYDQPLNSQELGRYKVLIRRRARREPVAYILGRKEFWSRDFRVSPGVLIPRPETEALVQGGLEVLDRVDPAIPARVLELGTGSGAVIISLAVERPGQHYVALDRSLPALAVALKNARTHLAPQNIRFFCGDWLQALNPQQAPYDLILANPPYISHGQLAELQAEISAYEPRQALDGGPDGLDALRRIVHSAPPLLAPGRWLLLEIGHDQAPAITDMIEAHEQYEPVEWINDLAGHRRVARIRKKNLRQGARFVT